MSWHLVLSDLDQKYKNQLAISLKTKVLNDFEPIIDLFWEFSQYIK